MNLLIKCKNRKEIDKVFLKYKNSLSNTEIKCLYRYLDYIKFFYIRIDNNIIVSYGSEDTYQIKNNKGYFENITYNVKKISYKKINFNKIYL